MLKTEFKFHKQEDRRLAAALVAVQLQQQQKQQQLHSQSQHEDSTLPDVSHLETLTPVNTYSIQTVPEPNAPPVYPTLQPFKRITHNVKQEFINVKSEYDVDVSAESSEDATPSTGPKRSLPHKKRIPRNFKQQTKRNSTRKDSSRLNSDGINAESSTDTQTHVFKCELCSSKFSSQLKFFEHLKVILIVVLLTVITRTVFLEFLRVSGALRAGEARNQNSTGNKYKYHYICTRNRSES